MATIAVIAAQVQTNALNLDVAVKQFSASTDDAGHFFTGVVLAFRKRDNTYITWRVTSEGGFSGGHYDMIEQRVAEADYKQRVERVCDLL